MEGLNKNIALAVCTGCSIGECIDVEHLMKVAGEEMEGIACMKHPALCSEEGLDQLHRLVRDAGADRLAIAACSPRIKSEQFRMEGPYVERINLREQVTWVMDPDDEDTLMCADDQVRMGLAKLGSISDNVPYIPGQVFSEILVVGGGLAGLTAALEGASAGYRVHLVEKNGFLGGYAGRLYKLMPTVDGQGELPEPDTSVLIERVPFSVSS